MDKKYFIDGISEIDYINQVARIRTFTLKRKINSEDYEVIPEIELITGIEGFVNCFNSMKAVMEKLVSEGIVKESIFDRTTEIKK